MNAGRQRLDGKGSVDGSGLAAGVAGADGKRMFAGTQGKWIDAEIIRRLAVGLDDGAVDDPFDINNLGLTVDGDRHRLGFGQGRLVIGRKIGGQDRRQRLDGKGSVDGSGLAAGVAGADGKRMFAGTQGKWIDAEIIRRLAVGMNDAAIDDPFDVGNFGLTADGD